MRRFSALRLAPLLAAYAGSLACNAFSGIGDFEKAPSEAGGAGGAQAGGSGAGTSGSGPAGAGGGETGGAAGSSGSGGGNAGESGAAGFAGSAGSGAAGAAGADAGIDSGSCSIDGSKNGSETDQDCGGGECPACMAGKSCVAGSDCESGNCPDGFCSACAAGTVAAVSPDSSVTYCIDETEVTNSAYAAFLATSPSTALQPPECVWNDTFFPSSSWPPAGNGSYPVVFVDWCDAHAYCSSAGKRLCGAIDGGASAYASYADANVSQWFNACSMNGTRSYCYGNSWAAFCNDGWFGFDAATAVKQASNCIGGFPGLYDMTANVWEWEDSCAASTGQSDQCRVRGAAFDVKQTGSLRCNTAAGRARNLSAANVGFRCCKD